ncbi:MAG: 2-C-methyl-D-erythritol 4-phosphate cytidylyltransferase [Clostridia bacterium]|nr:2-C-methyl-D-erythritol 4-phosphate cytidylyltransferase [Clostridia bacterium]
MNKPFVSAVIVAAGSSTRMGQPKQLLPLGGMPVLARTLQAFQQCETVDEIVLVARQEDLAAFTELASAHAITKLAAAVAGGSTRQQSVQRGVAACDPATAYVAIHDGARPLVTPEQITATVNAAMKRGAAALAVPVKDTIKIADENGCIAETPDRRRLWNVQTPQVFGWELYQRALTQSDIESLTDDCQLVERLGAPIRLVEGSYRNLKITTPEDLAVAEELLKS